jgi:hypothetical protein
VVVAAVVVGATLDDVLVVDVLLDGLSESLPPHPTAKARRAEPPRTAAAVLTW